MKSTHKLNYLKNGAYFMVLLTICLYISRWTPVIANEPTALSYSFNESSGTSITDSSNNNNAGTVSGATRTDAGKYGKALSFDGANDMVTTADSASLDLTAAMTLEAWVNPASIADWRTILMKERSGNLAYALYASTETDKPSGEATINNSNIDIRPPAALTLNTWTHIAVTYDGSKLKYYINATEVASKDVSGSIITSNGSFRIGGNSVWGEYFSGTIDEVRIYSRALSASEIQTDMNTPINPPTTTVTPINTPTPTPGSNGAQTGQWSTLKNWPLVAVHATVMNTGKVLMWDGWEIPALSRVWDPSNESFIQLNNNSGLFCSGHSTMADGRILVAGGHDTNGDGIQDTNIFNPGNQTWTRVPDMADRRWYPSTTTLSDGRVLALSGATTGTGWADTPELYNPTTNSWSALTGVSTSDLRDIFYPHPYMQKDGTLYVISPTSGKTWSLDVGAKTWISKQNSPVTNGATTMYLNGKILMTGGGPDNGSSQTTAAVIDLNASSPSWRTVQNMAYGRFQHNLITLPDGKVLVIGGASTVDKNGSDGPLAAELWDPGTETWTTMAAMTDPRLYHSIVLLLPDGRVLAAGGGRYGSTTNYFTAQYYSPPYLFKGARPSIGTAPGTINYNQQFTIQTPDADAISKVTLLSLGSTTHTIDMNQRYLELSFSKSSGSLSVQAPANSSLAPAGYYMVFLINSSGVPSVGKIVQVAAATGPTSTPAPTPTPTSPGPSVTPTPSPTATQTPTPTPTTAAGTGLVLALGLNEASGNTVTDSSGKGNNGTITGATRTTSGQYGKALNFDGVNDWITINDANTLDLTNAMTLEGWVKPSSTAGWRTILLKERSGGLAYSLYNSTDTNKPSGELSTVNSSTDVRSPSALTLNAWTHVAVTYDGSSLRYYVNGTEVASKSFTGSIISSTGVLRIGGNAVWGEYFKGLIDEIRIYNRALTPAEISTDKNQAI